MMYDDVWIRPDGRRELHHNSVHCMGDSEFSLWLVERPSGRVLYSIGGDGGVGVLPGRTGRVLHEIRGSIGAFGPDGRSLVTLDRKKRVRVYESESGGELWVSGSLHARATYPFFSRDGGQVIVADRWEELPNDSRPLDEVFRYFDAATGGPINDPLPPPPPRLRGITQQRHQWP